MLSCNLMRSVGLVPARIARRLPFTSQPATHLAHIRPCHSTPTDSDTPTTSAPQPATPPRPAGPARRPMPPQRPSMPPVIMGPDGQPLKVVQIERAGDEAWAGVAAIDKGEGEDAAGRAGLLVAGDAAMLLLFAVIGRINHGEVLDVETLTTALPFAIGWFTSAAILGGYGKEARGSEASPAALTAAKCWALGTPLGLVLRGLSKGYVPPTPFIVVSLAATGVLLIGWRAALAAATPQKQPMTRAQQLAARKDKRGGPLEFLQLLFGLVSRW